MKCMNELIVDVERIVVVVVKLNRCTCFAKEFPHPTKLVIGLNSFTVFCPLMCEDCI
jgi:hypothetical protein